MNKPLKDFFKKKRKKKAYNHMDYDLSKYEKEVLSSIPNPFGSFEKAKYEMVACNHQRQLKWSFVTTCRNTEDCIEIIKSKV